MIVRSYAMGCFAGTLDEENSTETKKILTGVRRLWQWSGAASLSQLAITGTSNPEGCKFPCETEWEELTSPQGFEVIQVTEEARKSIASVPIWKV